MKKILKLLILLVAVGFLFIWCVKHLFPLAYLNLVREASDKYGLSVFLIESVIKAESNFNQKAVSEKEAKGLMQVTSGTADWCAKRMGISEFDLYNPKDNIEIGTYYFAYLLERYKGNIQVAAAAYNAGHGNVDKWLKNDTYSKDGINLTHIPYKETQRYVRKVSLYNRLYTFLYKSVLKINL